MKLKSLLTSPKSLQRLLVQLGEPTEIPGRAPARGPAYFSSQVVRRSFGESAHLDMVD